MARKTVAWRADLKAVPEPAPREGQTFQGESLVVRLANLVRLPHTVFALPFALIGLVYASYGYPVTIRQAALVILAFTAARFAAMGFNRLADRHIDAKNPRTRNRELPRGRLTATQAGLSVAVASVVFVGASAALNSLCFRLSPVALAWVLLYSITKRFTNWSHLWLGASLAIAPVGGYLAISGQWSTPLWPILCLSAAVLLWVAGFDMFYALQDEEFDTEHGLHSAVVLLGASRSIIVAKLFHGLAIGLLLAFGYGAGLGVPYYVGVAVAAGILVWEHSLVHAGDLSKLDAAFFTMNGIMSIVVFAGSMVDRFV